MSTIRLPLLPNPYVIGYPAKEGKTAEPVRYFALPDVLTRGWTTDAHTTAYSVSHLGYRLKEEAISDDGGVTMVLFIADVDCELSHAANGGRGDMPAPDEWWLQELPKIDVLREVFPNPVIYRTKGGYRILYRLATPRTLASAGDVESWQADYLAWVAVLRRRFHIYADAACRDWQRLYRVPHATRTRGGRSEAREVIGNPYHIGPWTCEPAPDERELAKTLGKKPSKRVPREHRHAVVSVGDGVLFYAFKARGWVGETLDSGKWSVKCPWEDQHSKGATFNTSTVLFAPGSGDTFGWLHCSHAHCQYRDIRDVLRVFSEDELDRAKREAGVMTPIVHHKSHVRMYKPHFGLRVKGVRHAS
jgi:hypothetical protein